MQELEKFKQHLKVGGVYRRAELAEYSDSVDRYLRQLVDSGELRKLWKGVYYRPRMASFGELPPERSKVIATYLKDDNFLITSLNIYNALKVGTTQLYNVDLVYNHKRSGLVKLNRQNFYFFKGRKFPKKVTEEFLLVDLVNNLKMLAEDLDAVKRNVAERFQVLGMEKVLHAARNYGKVATRKFFERLYDNRIAADVRWKLSAPAPEFQPVEKKFNLGIDF